MQKAAAVLLTGAFLVTGSALASAGGRVATPSDQAPSAREVMVQGEIVALDAAEKTLAVKVDDNRVLFRTEASTRYSRGESAAVWNDLKVGDKVSVSYLEQDSEKIAVRIALGAR